MANDKKKTDDGTSQKKLEVPGVEHGKVVVRFAPEPSGYLHIGHAKSAMIDQHLKEVYDGKLILRFDDTNPALEEAEYEDAIIEDLKLLNVQHDRLTHSSDYFQQLIDVCEKLISKGILYCDDTEVEQMREERKNMIDSKCKNNSIEENLRRWNEMKAGSEEGLKNIVRANLNMKDTNAVMRDFACYRCVGGASHHITGDKYKVYPMYDFCCPIIDAWEGVTHALRSNEYSDRIPQYHWVQRTAIENDIASSTSIIYEFSRLNLVNTCLSKRKLKWIIDSGIVTGWDDPRFPTIRGIRRRGMSSEAIMEFILEQGASKNANMMEWDKIWAINRKVLEERSPRWAGISNESCVTLTINGAEYEVVDRDLHPTNKSIGIVKSHRSSIVGVERDDIERLGESEEFTLLKYTNVKLTSVTKDTEGNITEATGDIIHNGDYKKTKKLHWVPMNTPEMSCKKATVFEYEHIITKKKMDDNDDIENVVNRDSCKTSSYILDPEFDASVDGLIQLERRGFFRVDSVEGGEYKLIAIPEGRTKNMSVIKGKVDAKALTKGSGGKTAEVIAKKSPDDVSRIQLVVGKIIEVWPHPDADKLWCEKIDIGNGEIRQIASGLRDFIPKEEMLNSSVIVVANLPSRPLRGFPSHGMVLCASNADHTKVEFMKAPEGTPLGELLTFEGINGSGPDEVLPKKKSPWDACAKLFTVGTDSCGYFKEGHKLMSSQGEVKCSSITGGTMS